MQPSVLQSAIIRWLLFAMQTAGFIDSCTPDKNKKTRRAIFPEKTSLGRCEHSLAWPRLGIRSTAELAPFFCLIFVNVNVCKCGNNSSVDKFWINCGFNIDWINQKRLGKKKCWSGKFLSLNSKELVGVGGISIAPDN